MLNEDELAKYISWIMESDDWCWDYPDVTIGDFFKIVGDDTDGLVKALSGMGPKKLWYISGLFYDISEKWPELTGFLDNQRLRIIQAGFQL